MIAAGTAMHAQTHTKLARHHTAAPHRLAKAAAVDHAGRPQGILELRRQLEGPKLPAGAAEEPAGSGGTGTWHAGILSAGRQASQQAAQERQTERCRQPHRAAQPAGQQQVAAQQQPAAKGGAAHSPHLSCRALI